MSGDRVNHLLTFTNDDFRVELKIDGITEFGWSRAVIALMDALGSGSQVELIVGAWDDAKRCSEYGAAAPYGRCLLLRGHTGTHAFEADEPLPTGPNPRLRG